MENRIQYEHIQPVRIEGDGGLGNLTTKEVYTSADYIALTEVLIEKIKNEGYTSIVAIARGGLSILAMLEKYGKGKLPSDIHFGAVHAASYTGIGSQKEIYIADAISFLDGGGVGAKPLFLDDMLDSANSQIAINKWAIKRNIVTQNPDWAVLLQKEHSKQDATHVAQYVSNKWAVQPHENYEMVGENIAKILTTPNPPTQEENFDNLQRFAERIGLDIFRSGQNPSSIIGKGDIRTAHVASMISRILVLPNGTHFRGGELSFINPEQGRQSELGDTPLSITLPYGESEQHIASLIREGNSRDIFTRYKH